MMQSGTREYFYETRLRDRDFEDYLLQIKKILIDYIYAKNKSGEAGWQTKAQYYLDNELSNLATSGSLILLKQSLNVFTTSLRSSFNYCASYFFSDPLLSSIGSYSGAPGSSLKARLEAISSQIQPFSAKYVVAEFRSDFLVNFFRAQSTYGVNPIDILSKESFQVLDTILKDPQSKETFLIEGAICVKKYNIIYSIENIVDFFNKQYPQGYEESHSNKQKTWW